MDGLCTIRNMSIGPFNISLRGIQSGFHRLNESAARTARLANTSPDAASDQNFYTNNVSPEESITQMLAVTETRANLRVINVANDLEKQILDIKA